MRVLLSMAGLLSGLLGAPLRLIAFAILWLLGGCIFQDAHNPYPYAGDGDMQSAIDDSATCEMRWFADDDGDGYGDDGSSVDACNAPDGFVSVGGDCDDADAATHPGGTEVCDGADNDCDGAVDEDAVNPTAWVADRDGDEFGSEDDIVVQCSQPGDEYVPNLATNDCDDADAAVHPGASETCNGVDDDCDGTVDEDATDALTWIVDADGDGYGDAGLSGSEKSCTQPTGMVNNAGDCDDSDPTVNPAASEVNDDNVDNDCDDEVDEGADCYRDADGDGYGDPTAGRFASSGECAEGYVTNSTDCLDTNYTVNPGVPYDDPYDGTDADCDGFED